MTILVSVLVLGILIFVHELGHFLVAKACGVGVVEFAIGFGRKIISKRIGETRYSLNLIPLGGYVRMVGDEPHDLHHPEEELKEFEEEAKEDRELNSMLKDRSRWFLEQGVPAKSAIVIAGPAFNYIFAILLATVSFITFGKGVVVDQPIIGNVIPDYPADKAGLEAGDLVKRLDDRELTTWEELAVAISRSGGKEMSLLVERKTEQDGSSTTKQLEIKVTGTPDTAELQILDDGPQKGPSHKIGITPDFTREPVGTFEAIGLGFSHSWYIVKITVRGLWGMIKGAISPNNIAGPIFIFKEAANSAKRGIEHLFDFMIFLSISLAVLNLLPIPVLDGGHMMFFLFEAIMGKPVSIRIQELANQVGMFLLFALMIFAVGNDIMRLL